MLARHAILLTPSIAASLPLACRGAERTFLAPHACTRPKNPLSSFLATDPKKHLLSPIIATLPKRTEITPVFATHPRPPWEASPFLFALSAAERNTSLAIALPQSPILLLLILLRTLWHNRRLTTLFQSTDYTLFPSRRGVYPISLRQKRRPAHKSGVQLVAGSTFQLPPEKVLEVAHLLRQQIQFARQALNFRFGAAVDGVVQFTAHAILHVLAVLAHHDDRRLDGREQRQDEIQQDKRIGVPGRPLQAYVDGRIGAAQDEKTNDEGPRPAELHHGVRDALGQRRFCFDHFVRVAHRAKTHEMLRSVELPPQHSQHIHSRVRLALQQRRDVSAADFHALRFLNGRRAGLMRRLLQHRREAKKLAVRRLIHHDFLLIFVDCGDPHFSGDHHVGLPARVTHLVDALPRSEILQLHLSRQHGGFVFVEQGEQRNVFQHFGIAGHRPPLPLDLDRFSVFQAFDSRETGNSSAHNKPDEWRGFKKHSAEVGNNRRAAKRRPTAHASLDNLNFHGLSRGMLRQQRGHSLRPAFESFRAAERDDDCQHVVCRALHHRSFRIACRAAVWPSGVGEEWQAFQIQIVLADTLVRFARASRAKNNFAGHMPQVIQSNRQAAFHRNEIDHVHHGVDLRQAFSCNHPPQQRLRRTAVPRRIFSQRFVRFARHFYLRRLQHAAREGQFLNFRFSRLHLLEQRRRRCAR